MEIKLVDPNAETSINDLVEAEIIARSAPAKPGDKFCLFPEKATDAETAEDLDKTADLIDDAEVATEMRRLAENLRRGRKPKPASKLRRNKTILRFTDAELATINGAIDADEEFAVAVRELALEAAEARLAKIGE